MKWAIGYDLGFGETGLVLVRIDDNDKRTPVAWATMTCGPDGSNANRAVSLADAIIEKVVKWVQEHDIKRLSNSIETPYYNTNPNTYEKQYRLLQAVESGIIFVVSPLLEECEIVELSNSTSKHLATGLGDASKLLVLDRAPKAIQNIKANQGTRTTVGDAWAHSLAAWTDRGQERMSTTELKAAKVDNIIEGAVDEKAE